MIKRLFRIMVLFLIAIIVVIYLIKRPAMVITDGETRIIQVSTDILRNHVKFLSEDTNRNYDDPLGLNLASRYIKQQFNAMGLQTVEQSYQVDGKNYHNISVKLGPVSDEIIVVGAHYDVFGYLPGADDNASGVAGLIELGRLLKGQSLSQGIELVAYTLEEPPFFAGEYMGSYIHANSLKQKVKLMISIEMIGYFSDEAHSQDYPSFLMGAIYPSKGDFIAVVDQLWSTQGQQLKNTFNRFTAVEAFSINAPSFIPGVDFSDHRNYWANEIPAIMVTDTSFYRNKNYHTEFDTYEKLDYDKMAQVTMGIFKHLVGLQNP